MNTSSQASAHARSQPSEAGMAVLIFISLLAIMVILVMAELRCVFHLHREVKFLEQQQIKRLSAAVPQTANTNAAINPAAP
jgi:hypothetical protein